MNIELYQNTPIKFQSLIKWCKLEDVNDNLNNNNTNNNDNNNNNNNSDNNTTNSNLLSQTTIAYMYDLCLKRLTRRSKLLTENPHWSIQNILLDSNRMPSLKYFISTYEENFMYHLHGNCWKLIEQVKFPCSTNSYIFYLYERVVDNEDNTMTNTENNSCDHGENNESIKKEEVEVSTPLINSNDSR